MKQQDDRDKKADQVALLSAMEKCQQQQRLIQAGEMYMISSQNDRIVMHEPEADGYVYPSVKKFRLENHVILLSVGQPRLVELDKEKFGHRHYHIICPFLTVHGVLEYRYHVVYDTVTKFIKQHVREPQQ